MRKKYVIANFKMNKLDSEIEEYLSTIMPLTMGDATQVVLAVPSVSIKTASEKAKDSGIIICAQNVDEHDFGAYTGEVNPEMIKAVGAMATLVGHSERRSQFEETDEKINKKILSVLKSGLIAIVCVGESIYDKKNNLTEKTLQAQLTSCLSSIYANEFNHIVIAYEPVWAIGTGVTPTVDEIEKSISCIRSVLTNMYDENIANSVSIVYGGSVSELNIREIAKVPNLDGVLVGASSLIPEKFGKIVANIEKKKN